MIQQSIITAFLNATECNSILKKSKSSTLQYDNNTKFATNESETQLKHLKEKNIILHNELQVATLVLN